MKELHHPNVVEFLESYLVNGRELWIVTEFMDGGALTHIIENNVLSSQQVSKICLEVRNLTLNGLPQRLIPCPNFLQTCKGLAYLHSQCVIHRDIKSGSIVLDSQGRVKISMLLCFHI